MGVLERVREDEEREEEKELEELESGEFRVMGFVNWNGGEIEVEGGDCRDYRINGGVRMIFREK